ncbi:HlyD family efflux transporter periplasmic adaptor subunit [Paenibacillus sp. P25]|nr:HlyD family efflux transporter periplasmic adaptor subunit [Paenibacillus sp. P25]
MSRRSGSLWSSCASKQEKAKLVSNVGGIVTYIDPIKQGDPVTAYKQLVTVSDPKRMKLVYEVMNVNDLIGIQVGMDADVKFKNKALKGKVVQIPATAPQSDVKAIAEKNAKSVVISVEDLPPEAAIGNNADLTIVTEKRENVLVIPKVGLRTYLGRDYVQVLEGRAARKSTWRKASFPLRKWRSAKGLRKAKRSF